MRELIAAEMIWEKRVGRGFANQIYIADRPELHAASEFAVQDCAPFKNEQSDASRTAKMTVQEPSKQPSSYIDNNKKEKSDSEKSLSVPTCEDIDLTDLYKRSEVDNFPESVSAVFKSAMFRLYNAKSYDSDAGCLTREEIRRYLENLNSVVLEDVYQKVAARKGDVTVNQLGYLAQAILNATVADGGRTNVGVYFQPDYLSGFRELRRHPEVAVYT